MGHSSLHDMRLAHGSHRWRIGIATHRHHLRRVVHSSIPLVIHPIGVLLPIFGLFLLRNLRTFLRINRRVHLGMWRVHSGVHIHVRIVGIWVHSVSSWWYVVITLDVVHEFLDSLFLHVIAHFINISKIDKPETTS